MPTHANPDEVLSLTGQLRFFNLQPQLLGNHLWDNEKVLREGGAAVNGALFVSGFWADSPKTIVRDFVTAFSARFGRRPDQYAAQSYDAARMLVAAFDGAKDREEVRSRLSNLKGFEGVTGETTFEGGTQKVLPILKIENGRLKQVQ
jgi:branched-chain amino acid transport system substrate-binding protein